VSCAYRANAGILRVRPHELVANALSYLRLHRERAAARAVCRHWHDTLPDTDISVCADADEQTITGYVYPETHIDSRNCELGFAILAVTPDHSVRFESHTGATSPTRSAAIKVRVSDWESADVVSFWIPADPHREDSGATNVTEAVRVKPEALDLTMYACNFALDHRLLLGDLDVYRTVARGVAALRAHALPPLVANWVRHWQLRLRA
jgi:hypothetical protein